MPSSSEESSRKVIPIYASDDYLTVEIPEEVPVISNSLSAGVKRIFDLTVAIPVLLLFLSWLIPVLAIIIKISSRGPVFFKQKRSGFNNIPFTCYKLRSMYLNSEADMKQATIDDSRITSIGAILRKFSLDELPQFFNVLLGDMSVIGPRPHMLQHTLQYSKFDSRYHLRQSVKPGITGLSQVMGYRGEIKNSHAIRNRVRLDLFYIRKWSLGLDLMIVVKTTKLLLFGDQRAY